MSEQPSKTIGWLYPGALDRVHLDFFHMTPPDVNLVIGTRMWALSMMHAGRFDPEAFEQERPRILEAARDIARQQRIDYLVHTGDLIQAAMGHEWDRGLAADLADAVGVPATTAMTAVVDALRELGATRIAAATPWRDDQNEHVIRYMDGAGIEVALIRGFPTTSIQDVRNIDPDEATELVRRVHAEAGDVDAIYIGCPVWPGRSAAIEPLEQELGVPVVAFFNPILWKALRALDYPAPVHGYGRLLASLPERVPA